jgi:hypothetical protein
MTISAADAAKHAVENPWLNLWTGDHQILVTLGILMVLAVVFLKGFREAIEVGHGGSRAVPSVDAGGAATGVVVCTTG